METLEAIKWAMSDDIAKRARKLLEPFEKRHTVEGHLSHGWWMEGAGYIYISQNNSSRPLSILLRRERDNGGSDEMRVTERGGEFIHERTEQAVTVDELQSLAQLLEEVENKPDNPIT